jgi:heme ABC exporter ATP-binding subunit CcmA
MKDSALAAAALTAETDGQMPTIPTDVVKSVEVVGLRKAYGLRPVLRDVSLAATAGQCLAVLGPNGAGKTTLLRVLATLTRPAKGVVTIAGYDALRESHEVRRVIGYVGHTPLLYDELTARENLLFFARMHGLTNGEERADHMLQRVGMRNRANDRVGTFSRGQAQRVALARGILHDPRVLLLDEPDTGLDEDAMRLLDELIRERSEKGTTTLLTTHSLERGLAWSDALVALVDGRVVLASAASDLSANELRALFASRARRGGR